MDMRNRITVGRSRTYCYCDRDSKNQPLVSTRFHQINSNRGHAVAAVQIRGRQK